MSFVSKWFSHKTAHTPKREFVLEADLHCHLLPDWDDGPRSMDESLKMAAHAAQLGVKRIVATPHVGRSFKGKPEKPAHEIPSAVASFNRNIQEHKIDLEVIPGAEIILSTPNLMERLKNEPWLTVGGHGHYVLVESPVSTWSDSADKLLFEIALLGITPILAHPERLVDVQQDISAMESLVQRGTLLQLTARAIIGDNRRSHCCKRLLEAGLVTLVASDAHNIKAPWPTQVASTLCEIIGEERTQNILIENPLSILDGKSIQAETNQ